MKRHRRRPSPKPGTSAAALERLHPDAAGIDCGSAEHFVAVPPDRDATPVRSFATFTGDLHRLADWLSVCRVTHVAMEATGIYWIAVFEILDARGFQVILVNARHVKNLPGRKSDVSDCEWLRDLHILRLLRGSHASEAEIIAALTGNYRSEHVFVLQQNLELFDVYQQQLAACDAAIDTQLGRLTAAATRPTTPLPVARRRQKPQANEPRFDLRTPLHQLTGADLSQIDGIGPYTALRLLAEIGTDMTRWPTDKHFTSWLTLAPNNRSPADAFSIVGRSRRPIARPPSSASPP